MKRGAQNRGECIFVGAWVPIAVVQALDDAVQLTDSDRSKLIRDALRDKITRVKEAA